MIKFIIYRTNEPTASYGAFPASEIRDGWSALAEVCDRLGSVYDVTRFGIVHTTSMERAVERARAQLKEDSPGQYNKDEPFMKFRSPSAIDRQRSEQIHSLYTANQLSFMATMGAKPREKRPSQPLMTIERLCATPSPLLDLRVG